MITRDEFIANFSGRDVPELLLKLWDFDQTCDCRYFAEGFEFVADAKGAIATWCNATGFLERLLPFAQANGSGSVYALWLPSSDTNLRVAPVIIFGDEGGVHVVAENISQLLRLLTFDAEPIVDFDSVCYCRFDDQEFSPHTQRYADWLAANAGLTTIQDPKEIVGAAQSAWKSRFVAWAREYVELD